MLRAFLAFMHATRLPWEAAIFDWFCGAASQARALQGPRGAAYTGEAFEAWHELFMQHEPVRPERLQHAYFARAEPIAMTIDVVEAIWARIAEDDDWSALDTALAEIEMARQGYDLGRDRIGFLP